MFWKHLKYKVCPKIIQLFNIKVDYLLYVSHLRQFQNRLCSQCHIREARCRGWLEGLPPNQEWIFIIHLMSVAAPYEHLINLSVPGICACILVSFRVLSLGSNTLFKTVCKVHFWDHQLPHALFNLTHLSQCPFHFSKQSVMSPFGTTISCFIILRNLAEKCHTFQQNVLDLWIN